MKKITISVLAILSTILMLGQNTHSLTIEISDIQNYKSSLFTGIYNDENSFKTKTHALDSIIIVPTKKTAKITFKDIADGEYAIAIFQDTNNNGKLDIGKFNIPKEPVGISNFGTKKIIAPPTYNKAKIKINGDTIVSIPLISK